MPKASFELRCTGKLGERWANVLQYFFYLRIIFAISLKGGGQIKIILVTVGERSVRTFKDSFKIASPFFLT